MKTNQAAIRRLDDVVSVADMRLLAKRILPRSVFDFVDGGAEDELTLRENRAAFHRVGIVPRILTDVSKTDTSIDVLGQTLPVPLIVCPMGSCTLVRPEADLAIARAAAACGVPYTLSTMSTTSIENMARSVKGQLWFQLYVLKNLEFNMMLIDKARDYGFSALVVTADLQAGGKRERDIRNRVSIPVKPTPRQLIEGVLRPGWSFRFLRAGLPQFENVKGYMNEPGAGLSIAALVGQNLHAGFDWDEFSRIRDRWRGHLYVKGVMHPSDAKKLIALGADGLWISNHGGRQLDGAIASFDALVPIAAAVGNNVPLIVDSGVRRGVDVLKARARGASAAAIGRPALFGASVGEAGVRKALDILTEELALALKLSGVARFRDVDEGLLRSAAQLQGGFGVTSSLRWAD